MRDDEVEQVKYLLLKSYLVRYRQGWENSLTEDEVMLEIRDWLWNHELDPSCHKANVNRLIKKFERKDARAYWESVERRANDRR